uniref:Si:ch211-141e20.2 n=1 Tax=Iconisemion striatum TaxID=60296 RepID=A0A1A7X9W4_9TELE
MFRLLFLLVVTWNRHVRAQVTGGSATVELGSSATLPCKLARPLARDETLEQISWQRLTKGKPKTDNFFTIKPTEVQYINGNDKRFEFIGLFSDQNGTLQLDNVTLNDEGTYTCILTFFPTGSQKTTIPLRVLVPPSINVAGETPVLGDQDVLLATCTAAGSKPQANVWWDIEALRSNDKQNSTSVSNSNGTFTIKAFLYGRPTKDIYGRSAQCVVSHEALRGNTTVLFTTQVYFAPEQVKITQKSPNVLECDSTANPSAAFTWSRHEQSLPSTVNKHNAMLELTGWSPDLNGLYQCEASNAYGAQQTFLYVHLSSEGNKAGWILFGLLLVFNLAAAAFWLFRNYNKCLRSEAESHDAPPEQTVSLRQEEQSL